MIVYKDDAINALEYGQNRADTYNVTANDGTQNSSTQTLAVRVTGADDLATIAKPGGGTGRTYTAEITKPAAGSVAQEAISLTVTDVDTVLTTGNLTLSGADANKFTIASVTRDGTTNDYTVVLNWRSPDEISPATYSVTLGGPAVGANDIDLTFNVAGDVPTFEALPQQAISVPENAAFGLWPVIDLNAIAPIAGAQRDVGITYSFVRNAAGDAFDAGSPMAASDAQYFTLGTSDGRIVLTKALPDQDVPNPTSSLTIYVKATYTLNGQPKSAVQQVTVNIDNVVDAPPVVTSDGSVTVDENIPTDTVIYTATAGQDTATAGQDDGGSVTYRLTGADADDFTIDASTGEVKFKISPDYEIRQSYSFNVVATQGGLDSTPHAVVVNIDNVVENAQQPQPVAVNALPVAVADTAAIALALQANATITVGDNAGRDSSTIAGRDGVTHSGDVLRNDTDPNGDTLTVVAVRHGNNSFELAGTSNAGTVVHGTYGELTLDADGGYTYTANKDAARQLGNGETRDDVFYYQVSDGRGGTSNTTLTISVTGKDDPTTGSVTITNGTEGRTPANAQVGDTLTAGINTISDPDGPANFTFGWQSSFTYEWQRADDGGTNWSKIDGATGYTYILAQADAGKKIRVEVTFTDAKGVSHSHAKVKFVSTNETGAVTAAASAGQGSPLAPIAPPAQPQAAVEPPEATAPADTTFGWVTPTGGNGLYKIDGHTTTAREYLFGYSGVVTGFGVDRHANNKLKLADVIFGFEQGHDVVKVHDGRTLAVRVDRTRDVDGDGNLASIIWYESSTNVPLALFILDDFTNVAFGDAQLTNSNDVKLSNNAQNTVPTGAFWSLDDGGKGRDYLIGRDGTADDFIIDLRYMSGNTGPQSKTADANRFANANIIHNFDVANDTIKIRVEGVALANNIRVDDRFNIIGGDAEDAIIFETTGNRVLAVLSDVGTGVDWSTVDFVNFATDADLSDPVEAHLLDIA